MLRKLGLALALCSLTTAALAGTVYKWMDRSGQVHYTDRPPRAADAKVIAVIQQASGAAEMADAASGENGSTNAASGSESSPEGAPDAASAEMMKAVQADVAKTRADQCKKAQERYKNYVESPRVYREKDGKREYLDSKQLDEARLRARQDVDTYCK